MAEKIKIRIQVAAAPRLRGESLQSTAATTISRPYASAIALLSSPGSLLPPTLLRNPLHEISLRADCPSQTVALAERQTACGHDHDQSGILGRDQGHAETVLSGRSRHRRRRSARQRLRQPELDLARIRPARRRLAHVRHFRPVWRAVDLHHERQDGPGAARRHRRGTAARLGDRGAQLRADRSAGRLCVRREQGARGHPRDAARV